MLHGEPTWGYLYRKMIPPLADVGRAVVPDLIGFGRSDKPRHPNAYSYRAHVRWLRKFILALDLQRITLICQDWGGLLGFRMLAEMPERFARVVPMNTGLPHGTVRTEAFHKWRRFSQRVGYLDVPKLIAKSGRAHLSEAEAAAYQAPFPGAEYQTGAIAFPRLVPTHPDDPGVYENRRAVEKLRELDLPVFMAWGDADPIMHSAEAMLRGIFRNAAPTLWIQGAGHFIQEDAGEEVATKLCEWIRAGAVTT
jgi:haloalkane dehalogenase